MPKLCKTLNAVEFHYRDRADAPSRTSEVAEILAPISGALKLGRAPRVCDEPKLCRRRPREALSAQWLPQIGDAISGTGSLQAALTQRDIVADDNKSRIRSSQNMHWHSL